MGPTRIRDVVLVATLTAVVGYGFVSSAYGSLPPIRLFGGTSLLLLAAAEAAWAGYIRRKVSDAEIGTGEGRLPPLAVARAVVIAKASAWLAALMSGWWLAMLAYVLPRRAELAAASADTYGVLVGLASALALVAAALWLQHCCKSPPEPPATPAQ